MKKRKSPFGMIAVLAIIFVAVIIVNARSHADPAGPDKSAQQQQPDSSKPAQKAPDAQTLSDSLKAQVKGKKLRPQKPPNARPSIVNPYAEDTSSGNPRIKQKIDPSAGVQGGWYNKDSALNDNKK